ncbi:EAL domain-containing protein [Roseibium sp. MMSF_3544]|uniref:EAL domain-containing protein n=1 Tax=unclassified Roseibium TaxID=2629323 RepID=UPI00273E0834|nr:EAL domain-containing protein [Roseibium sp. MMSF_3544]
MKILIEKLGGRLANAILVAALLTATILILRLSGFPATIDRFLWEQRYSFDTRPVSDQIVFVDVDAKSLDEIGVWPFPRRIYADLTDTLARAGAQDIVFDVDFSAASNPEDDALFADAIERAGNVSLAAFRQAASAGSGEAEIINLPQQAFLENAWPVVVMVPMEADSRIWRNLYGYEIDGITEVSAAALLGEHTGDTAGSFFLDYGISIDDIKRVPLADVLNGTADLTEFSGKKVIIGASALELRDLFAVPVYGILPGAMVQALGAETLLQDRALIPQGEFYALAAAIFVLVLLLLTKVQGWPIKLGILVLSALATEVVAVSFQKSFPVLVPTASAYILFAMAAAIIVLRELGLHKLLAHIADIKQRNSERMLGQVFDDSFDAIIVLDTDCVITAANRTARSLFSSETLTGSPARTVLPSALVEESIAVLQSPESRMPVPQILVLAQEGTKRRFIEYVVTKAEKTLTGTHNQNRDETRALACLTCRDVTDERESAARLEYLARFDPITDLMNRSGFERQLKKQTKKACSKSETVCVFQFAVTNLDQIVATLGFSYGDRVRQSIASRLKSHLSENISWSAITADVFAGVCVLNSGDDAELGIIEEIQRIIGEDYAIDGARISVQLTFGYVLSEGEASPDTLLKKAGNALSTARRDSQNPVVRFQSEMDTALQRRRRLETELLKAIVRDELRLDYQPLVNLMDGSVFGVEALLRWDSREFGAVSPVEFIPIAEETGYILELGAWALNRGMKEVLALDATLRLSVNVSAVQFYRGNLVQTVSEALERSKFPADRLDLEVTESLFIDENQDLKFRMEELRALGCSFSMDDFGTGYSSLGYITKYPFSKIKLDKSFVRESLEREEDTAVVEAVLLLAEGYGMSVIVEGIETFEQSQRLQALGCRHGQGYYFGRPTSAAGIAAMLAKAA